MKKILSLLGTVLNYACFEGITTKNELSFKWNNETENINNAFVLFDLDQITLGSKTLDESDFIKFI
ncbi:hypothetical protein [Spiroplasma endosymbiont of Cantharis nigra]|uniref:hypothetical protein n=1 Tax=Spiroplasma endosymbiont of Cantharis nigra TaxID=3066278 RepID=UPI0030D4D9DB